MSEREIAKFRKTKEKIVAQNRKIKEQQVKRRSAFDKYMNESQKSYDFNIQILNQLARQLGYAVEYQVSGEV